MENSKLKALCSIFRGMMRKVVMVWRFAAREAKMLENYEKNMLIKGAFLHKQRRFESVVNQKPKFSRVRIVNYKRKKKNDCRSFILRSKSPVMSHSFLKNYNESSGNIEWRHKDNSFDSFKSQWKNDNQEVAVVSGFYHKYS